MDIDWKSKFIGMTTEEMRIYFSNTLPGEMEKYRLLWLHHETL